MQHYVNTHNLTDLDETGYASYKNKKAILVSYYDLLENDIVQSDTELTAT